MSFSLMAEMVISFSVISLASGLEDFFNSFELEVSLVEFGTSSAALEISLVEFDTSSAELEISFVEFDASSATLEISLVEFDTSIAELEVSSVTTCLLSVSAKLFTGNNNSENNNSSTAKIYNFFIDILLLT